MSFDRVPHATRTEDVPAWIEEWTTSPALDAMVHRFADEADPAAPTGLAERLAWLDTFSERWDFRGGAERNQARRTEFDAELSAAIMEAADALGMLTSAAPERTEYDHVFCLGGLVRACFNRPSHAAMLLRSGTSSPSVVGLGGFRPLAGDEPALAATSGHPELQDEFSAMDAGVRDAFGLVAAPRVSGEGEFGDFAAWLVHEYDLAGGGTARVVAAPSSEPEARRANTPDSYAWFATELAHLQAGQRVLAVTTSIYLPAQHAAALRMLAVPYGVEVESVGVSAESTVPGLGQGFEPYQYLQEMRSGIRSMAALVST